MATREAIYTALFALWSTARWGDTNEKRFVTLSRRVKLFSDVPNEQQPALYQAEHAEVTGQTSNLPYKRTFAANLIIYQATPLAPNVDGAVENNLILDALETAIAPKPQDPGYPKRNTLGGLVYHAYFDGNVFKDPGDIDNQAMMVVPVKMLVP